MVAGQFAKLMMVHLTSVIRKITLNLHTVYFIHVLLLSVMS